MDFVAIKGANTVYIQVTYLLATEEVVKREYGSLENIKDNYPKFVLSLDRVEFGNRKGIKWVNLIDFITGNYI
ncbi:MAG: ATP-binding protein [Bacillota bacterium]|nr:ATP-binding protein [Bacillota bacterium]